jgi:hypothetical protein
MDVLQKPVPRPTASNGRNRAIKNRTELTAGDMVIYPFLWGWQSKKGIISAEKMRPCVVLLRNETDRGPMLALLPITTHSAKAWHDRYPVPVEECQRVGMDPRREATIGMNDYNIDYIQESTYLRHNAPIRSFSDPFMQGLIGSFRDVLSQRRAVQVVRIPNPEAEFSLG